MTTVEFEKYIQLAQKLETPKRFHHSMSVADKARALAEKYGGCDPDKAYLAGILHDIMKNRSKDYLLSLFAKFDIILDDVEQRAEKLWHAIAGAAYIKGELGIDDPELIDAVRYHTTAKPEMSALCKILYVADFTSEDRDYEGVEDVRCAADENINKAVYIGLQFTVIDLAERDLPIHKDTLFAYNKYTCFAGAKENVE